jgi:HSP20 family protein
MTLVRWDPFREFAQFQDQLNAWVPPVDIYQNGDTEIVLKAELPDMVREDIDVTVDKGTLTIKGEKKFAGEPRKSSSTASSGVTGRSAARSRCRRPSTPPRSRLSTRTAS